MQVHEWLIEFITLGHTEESAKKLSELELQGWKIMEIHPVNSKAWVICQRSKNEK